MASCFQNIPFSLELKHNDIINSHKLVYQEVISDLSKNFPTNNVLTYYNNSVNHRLEALYKNVGTYLLFLHYLNAFIIVKSKNDEDIKKTSFKYFDELIFQASFLFNRVYELKIKVFKYLSIVDFNNKNLNISDIEETIECLKDGINQLIEIYSNYILNNHLLFIYNENESSTQYSIYLSSKVPEINNLFSQQMQEII